MKLNPVSKEKYKSLSFSVVTADVDRDILIASLPVPVCQWVWTALSLSAISLCNTLIITWLAFQTGKIARVNALENKK